MNSLIRGLKIWPEHISFFFFLKKKNNFIEGHKDLNLYFHPVFTKMLQMGLISSFYAWRSGKWLQSPEWQSTSSNLGQPESQVGALYDNLHWPKGTD